jgi:AcrR family transcriptional regulator
MVQPLPSRRERLRSQARAEAKSLALQQLADAGPSALSLNAIARQMGLTGPALYRYFTDRDALLAELILDAYADLATAVEAAVDEHRARPAADRFRAFAAAYRGWAIHQPHRYRLLFGAPVPGFAAHSAGIIAASQRTMDALLGVLAELGESPLMHAVGASRDGVLDAQLQAWAASRGMPRVGPEVLWRGVLAWSRLHGLVSLEIGGNFASIGVDARLLFEADVHT